MKAQQIVNKSCLSIQDISCYDIANDFSGPVLTVLVAFFSIKFAFSQLDRQHQNTLNAQKEEAKRSTQIAVFKEINHLLDDASSVIREASTFCITKLYPVPGVTSELNHVEYEALSAKLNQALLSVISKVESHEIINQKLFKTFRFFLQSIVHDVMQLRFNSDRKKVLKQMHSLSSDASMYLYDFQVCMQNLAYGEVFDATLSERIPPNKELKVISNDNDKLDILLEYVLNETNWGKSCNEDEAEAKEKYAS